MQFAATHGDKARNISRLLGLCQQGAAAGCQLLVLPELATTGYAHPDRASLTPLVEPIPGPTTGQFAAFAAHHHCYVVVGLPEVDPATGLYYNSAALVGPAGVVGVMRKVHLDAWDTRRVSAGNLGFPVWDTPLGRIAIQICMDACYPESSRLAALQGAEIICLPTAWFGEAAPAGDWFTRAYENGVYFIAADHWGTAAGIAFSGGSCILDPCAKVLAHCPTGDGLAIADLELPRAETRQRLAQRRPEHYADLLQSRLTWSYRFGAGPNKPPEGAVFTAAAIQTGSLPPTAAEARQHVEPHLRQAAKSGVRLVVLPELSSAARNRRAAPDLAAVVQAEPLPGPTTAWAAALCQELGLHLVLGLAEQAGDHCYNTAVLVGPAGVEAVHRKQHLSDADRTWATPGNLGWTVVPTPLGNLGLLLGDEALLPEPARCLALRDADVICIPAALAAPRPVLVPPAATLSDEPAWHLLRARASENNTYVIFANRAGGGFMGASGLFGPDAYQRPRPESLVEGNVPGQARLEITTRDYLAPHTPNPTRTKDRLRMRAVHLCAPLLQSRNP